MTERISLYPRPLFHMLRLESRTANPVDSIWSQITEEEFRRHLVELETRTNAVPVAPQTFPLDEIREQEGYTLPLCIEQQLADDLAFLAAVEEGAQSVAAVCLEERTQPVGLNVRFAALDLALSGDVKASLQQIVNQLIPSSHTHLEKSAQVDALFKCIIQLHFRRMLARLRSDKWEKPKYLSKQHKKPLWRDFANLLHRVQFLYTKKEAAVRQSVETHIQDMASTYEAFETCQSGSSDEVAFLSTLIKASYDFCRFEDVREFARRLEDSPSTTPTAKVASAIKCLRQIEKIAAYWRIAVSLVDMSWNYSVLFQSELQLEFLTPYHSVPTTIGYEAWATNCHVHAEIQLAVYYDLINQPSYVANRHATISATTCRRPRVIGTSKWLCYLCYLFLRCHEDFVPANTHGRLYDQWTIPDLADYGYEMRNRYRNIVEAIDKKIQKEIDNSSTVGKDEPGLVRWRAEPMTSRQNLLHTDSANP